MPVLKDRYMDWATINWKIEQIQRMKETVKATVKLVKHRGGISNKNLLDVLTSKELVRTEICTSSWTPKACFKIILRQ